MDLRHIVSRVQACQLEYFQAQRGIPYFDCVFFLTRCNWFRSQPFSAGIVKKGDVDGTTFLDSFSGVAE